MNARIRLVIGSIFLAALGCGTRSTLGTTDAGAKQDGMVGPDSRAFPDAFEVAICAPDLAPNRDVEHRDDLLPVPTDLAVSDLPLDLAARDAAFDGSARDLLTFDASAGGDGSPLDVGGDGALSDVSSRDVAVLDVAAPDVASPEVAGDALFSSIDGPLAAFCSGDFSHMVVNGTDSHPGVSGRIIPYDCCDGGEFKIVTATFLYPITVSWQSQVGPASGYPATIDLSNPPKGWSVRVLIGCDTATASCNPPPDSYTSGLQGVLQVSRGGSALDMSLCLHVQEPAGSPHPIVHTLDLYAPHVKTN